MEGYIGNVATLPPCTIKANDVLVGDIQILRIFLVKSPIIIIQVHVLIVALIYHLNG